MTTAPGMYEVQGGQLKVLPDGSFVFEQLKLKPAKPIENNLRTLKDIWKAEAPFSFTYMKSELIRHDIINEDGIWIYYSVRGNHRTCSVEVRALYETLLALNCIDVLSFPAVMELFNNTFNTQIKCSKVLENKNKCRTESDYFTKMFEGFANADANADIE